MTGETYSLPMVALRGLTILPEEVRHFDVSREKSLLAIEEAVKNGQKLFVSAQKDLETEEPGAEDVYLVGCVVTIRQVVKLPKKMSRVLVSGEARASLVRLDSETPYLQATVVELPDDEDVSIEGRRLCGIQIKDDDIRIKAGVKAINDANRQDIKFNTKNPAYIKMKFSDKDIDGNSSSTSIVSDKINLLGYNSRFITDGLTDQKELITDDKLKEIYDKAQRLPYGEELVEFLKLFVDAFMKHTHNFSNLPPNPAFTSTLLSESDRLLTREELLSDTVRIN